MKWILIHLYISYSPGVASVSSIEFDTKEACQLAGSQIVERIAPYTNPQRLNNFVCVPKG